MTAIMFKPASHPRLQAIDEERGSPHVALGVISGAVFLAALAALPFVGAMTVRAMGEAGAFSFTSSHASLMATGRALDSAAASLAADNPDRLGAWNDMVARELAEGDEAAARGLLLAAGAIVGGEAREASRARAEGDEVAALAAARELLDPANVRDADVAGLFEPIEAAPLVAAGDARDLAVQARTFLDGRGAALSDLVLTGVSVSAPEMAALFGADAAALQSGVITLKAALRSGRLQPQFLQDVQGVLQAVDADGRLSARLQERLNADGALADEPGAARTAFVESLAATPAWGEVAALLARVDALNDRAGWTGTVELLAHARSYQDMERLRLMAEARGASAVAIAKRTTDAEAFIALARSDFEMTGGIQSGLVALAGLLLLAALAPLVTLVHAVQQIWGGSSQTRRGARLSAHPGGRRPMAGAAADRIAA